MSAASFMDRPRGRPPKGGYPDPVVNTEHLAALDAAYRASRAATELEAACLLCGRPGPLGRCQRPSCGGQVFASPVVGPRGAPGPGGGRIGQAA